MGGGGYLASNGAIFWNWSIYSNASYSAKTKREGRADRRTGKRGPFQYLPPGPSAWWAINILDSVLLNITSYLLIIIY